VKGHDACGIYGTGSIIAKMEVVARDVMVREVGDGSMIGVLPDWRAIGRRITTANLAEEEMAPFDVATGNVMSRGEAGGKRDGENVFSTRKIGRTVRGQIMGAMRNMCLRAATERGGVRWPRSTDHGQASSCERNISRTVLSARPLAAP